MEDITEAADVGKGTFFNYFPTKEHVLATLGAERVAAVERALEKAKSGPVLPALKELATDLAGQSSSSPRAAAGHLCRACLLCAGSRGTAEEALASPGDCWRKYFLSAKRAARSGAIIPAA